MPKDWIAAVERGATLVTASDRLSRQLLQQYADHQLAAGREAWPRPDILPQGAFWRRLFDRLHEDGAILSQPLGALATAAWWEQAVSNSFREQPLLATAGAARTALDAWTLLREWQLDANELRDDFLDEARLLHRWGTEFEAECAARGWLPEYRRADAVIAACRDHPELVPQEILLAGFIDMPPASREHWQQLQALGATVEELAAPDHGGDAVRLACDDTRDENRRIAAWAATALAADPQQRLAVVVPDLAGRRDSLRRALLETLAPNWLPTLDADDLPFNFSLGESLLERALVRHALDLLAALADDSLEFVVAARLARSPYFGPREEIAARHELEAELRARSYAEFSLRDFSYRARESHCPAFAQALDSARERFIESRQQGNKGGQRLPSAWAREASRWLDVAGWCGRGARTLDSHEFQARDAFTDLLGRLAELDDTIGHCRFDIALGWLRRLASETLFQPRVAVAPVQVLGLFEATGMAFDAIWIAGLDDETLPAAPHPNPFLPLAMQREHELPQSSAVREQAFAERLFNGLLRAAPDVTCSFARLDGDAERRASALLDALNEGSSPALPETLAESWLGNASLESFTDTTGPALDSARSSGGTGLLADQSACPFRAYAARRLEADDWPTPTPGPDALLRGSLLHGVLEILWRRWRDRAELARRVESSEVHEDIAAAVDAVLEDSQRRERYRWRDSLLSVERDRLRAAVLRWVEFHELERPDFSVIEVEGHPTDAPPPANADYTRGLVHVQAGPLTLRGKLDRVDRLADGSELIIDYKTGSAPAPGHFFGERPLAPQLPAYVIARRQAGKPVPAGIAVASLKAGAEGLRGILRTDDPEAKSTGITGLAPVHKSKAVIDWDEAVNGWENMLERLGSEFAAGHAQVDPLPGACDYCHLAPLCRIHELRAAGALEEVDDE